MTAATLASRVMKARRESVCLLCQRVIKPGDLIAKYGTWVHARCGIDNTKESDHMYVKIDDTLPVHPKIAGLSNEAFRLYISAICWSNCNQTDGHVPARNLVYMVPGHTMTYDMIERAAKELAGGGLWALDGDGWQLATVLDGDSGSETKRPVLSLVPVL
jgi:hypothetical protein